MILKSQLHSVMMMNFHETLRKVSTQTNVRKSSEDKLKIEHLLVKVDLSNLEVDLR